MAKCEIASGAPIAGATIEVFNDATHFHYLTETNVEGMCSVSNLPLGTYHIQVSKPGFKTLQTAKTSPCSSEREKSAATRVEGLQSLIIRLLGLVAISLLKEHLVQQNWPYPTINALIIAVVVVFLAVKLLGSGR